MIIKTNKRDYFTQETENAITLYNNTTDQYEKNIIYEKYIHYSFFKLTQNIIHTFKFYHTEVDHLEHLQQEIIIFLLSKIHLFDPSKGSKAYSYFGTIVKNYLIFNNNKNYTKKVNFNNIDDFEEENLNYYEEENYELDNTNDLSFFIDKYIEHCNNNLNKIFHKNSEIQIAYAILELFKNKNLITSFDKRDIYLYIKEIVPYIIKKKEFNLDIEDSLKKYNELLTNNSILEITFLHDNLWSITYQYPITASQITKVSNKLYRIFKNNYSFYLENNYIFFKY